MTKEQLVALMEWVESKVAYMIAEHDDSEWSGSEARELQAKETSLKEAFHGV